MKKATDTVFSFILFFFLMGIFLIIWGIVDKRDLLALAGAGLIATCIHSIARLVK